MMCIRPYMQGPVGFGCGQCFPCRVNRRRLWTHRLLLERFCHDEASFVTLTYDQDHLPWPGTLKPSDMSGFIKRLRRNVEPQKIRFYGVGEYGDSTWRPHYHLALFGLSPLAADMVEKCWSDQRGQIGLVHVGELTAESAQYICGYTVKKMTAHHDRRLTQWRADGVNLYPEFARQSNRPGIGAKAMSVLADTVLTDFGLDEYIETGDVPSQLRHGGKKWPLGRYLREKLRKEIGVSEKEREEIKARFFAEKSSEMRALLEGAPLSDDETLRTRLVKPHLQKARSAEKREGIYNQRSQL